MTAYDQRFLFMESSTIGGLQQQRLRNSPLIFRFYLGTALGITLYSLFLWVIYDIS